MLMQKKLCYNRAKLFGLSLIALLLTGCTHFNEDRANQFQSLTQSQQAQYWQDKKIRDLTDQLEKSGATVYAQGDEHEILIPADKLFRGDTPQLSNDAKSTLQNVTKLINAQSTPSVVISAYVNNSPSKRRNLALSQSWADTTQEQLRQQGLLVGVLSTQAHGDCDNIGKHNRYTNRIEIHYRISHGN